MILTNVTARPGGDLLCVTSAEGWVGVWLPIDNRIVASHKHAHTINRAAWTADGEYLVITQADSLIVFSQDGTDKVREIATGHDMLRTFAVHPSKPIVATTGGDGVVRTWNVTTGEKLHDLMVERGQGSGGGTAVGMSDANVVVGYASGIFAMCNPDGTGVGSMRMFGSAEVASIARVPGAEAFVCGGMKGKLVHIVITPDQYRTEKVWDDPPKPIATNTIEFAPDGRFVAASSDDCARVYKNVTDILGDMLGRPFYLDRKPWKQDYIVSSACFVPKTEIVATSHWTGCVKLFRKYSHVEVRFVDEQPVWTRDGKPIADPIAAWPELA